LKHYHYHIEKKMDDRNTKIISFKIHKRLFKSFDA